MPLTPVTGSVTVLAPGGIVPSRAMSGWLFPSRSNPVTPSFDVKASLPLGISRLWSSIGGGVPGGWAAGCVLGCWFGFVFDGLSLVLGELGDPLSDGDADLGVLELGPPPGPLLGPPPG